MRFLAVQVDCGNELGISARSEECLMEADIRPEGGLGLTFLDRIIVYFLCCDNALHVFRPSAIDYLAAAANSRISRTP